MRSSLLTKTETVSWLCNTNVTCFELVKGISGTFNSTSLKSWRREGQGALRTRTNLKLSLSLIISDRKLAKKGNGRVKDVVADLSLPP